MASSACCSATPRWRSSDPARFPSRQVVAVPGEADKAQAEVDFGGGDRGVKRPLLRYVPLEKL